MIGMGVGILLEALDTRRTTRVSSKPARAARARLDSGDLARVRSPAQRRARTRTAVATAAVVAFALTGGAANYFWVNGLPRFLQCEVRRRGGRAGGAQGRVGRQARSPEAGRARPPAAPAAPPKG
jgi:hypothetical protein